MKNWLLGLGVLAVAVSSFATILPGFRIERLGTAPGFVTSIVLDSHGTLYYTTEDGKVGRFDDAASTVVARVTTMSIGNSGLLGMALIDDRTAVVHYTTVGQTYDVISRIDLTTGAETVLAQLACDIEFPARGSSSEHHGGNPAVGADGTIVVGIGDYGGGLIASLPEWNGGKIFRIKPDGELQQFAFGFRNPYDVSWDAAHQRAIVADNGAAVDDEINIVTEGNNYGWPFTVGNNPPIDGGTPPVYVFPVVVAPTGLVALAPGRNATLPRGYLLGAYVAQAIFWIPDIDAHPIPDPIALFANETPSVIDVTQGPDGEIYFTTGDSIFRLHAPQRGDCNGDGLVDFDDLDALTRELVDGPLPTTDAATGPIRGSFGCDMNGDGMIDASDLVALTRQVGVRSRIVRK